MSQGAVGGEAEQGTARGPIRRTSRRAVAGVVAGSILLAVVVGAMGLRRAGSDPDRIFLRADAAYKAGRPAEADAMLRRLERLRPPNTVERLLRAEVTHALGDDDRALAELAAIPDADAAAPLARHRAGQIEIGRGRTRPAEARFLDAIRLLPNGIKPRRELVYIYNIQRRQADLDATLGELLRLDALDFSYVLHWTKTRNTVWNPRGDLSSLEKFVAADPGDRWSRLSLAEAMRRLDRLDEARRILAPLPDSDPDARAVRILLAMDRGSLDEAGKLLDGGPADHPVLARLRGQLALRRHDGEAAVRAFRVAADADPTDRLAIHGLGTALAMLGRTEEARLYLESARRHDRLWALVSRASTSEGEKDPAIPRELGLACAAIGREMEARAWLRLAVSRDPGDSEAQQALYRLDHRPADNRVAAGRRSS